MEARTYTVAEIGSDIGRALERTFPDEVWVRGEIRDLNRSRAGHVYFTLLDPVPPGSAPEAALAVTLFAAEREAVNRMLTRSPGWIRMEDGVEVRIRGRVQFYPARGQVQLRMRWIDPEYTLGRLAAERERLLRSLGAEGVLERNKRRSLPALPLRVGLVTALGSAAAADFLHGLEHSGFRFTVLAADAAVQGAAAPASLTAAIRTLAGRDIQVLALVRGGGARTDLAAFDAETVARAVAACPVPVFTGIGHEIDATIADAAAHTSTKTPTACATAIVDLVRGARERAEMTWRAVVSRAAEGTAGAARTLGRRSRRLAVATAASLDVAADRVEGRRRRLVREAPRRTDRAHARTDARRDRLAVATRSHLRTQAGALAAQQRRTTRAARRAVTGAAARLGGLQVRVEAHDPVRALRRGWSITRTADGSRVGSVTDVGPGDLLVTRVADGLIDSTVTALPGAGEDGTIDP